MKRIAIILLVAAVAVTSCQKRLDDNLEVTDMSLLVAPTIYGQKAAVQSASNPQQPTAADIEAAIARSAQVLAAAQNAAQTRTEEVTQTKKAWEQNDKFSFFLSMQDDGDTGPIKFKGNTYNSMTYDNIVYTFNGVKFDVASKMFYPYRRSVVDLYGIYPHDAELGNNEAQNAGGSKRDKSSESAYPWTIFADQTSATGKGSVNGAGNRTISPKFNIEQSDLLFAKTLNAMPNNTGVEQPMVFKHMMTKVRIKLLVPDEFDGKQLNTTNPIDGIKILNTYLESLVDFRSDSVAVKRAESTTPVSIRPLGSETPEDGVSGTYYFFEGVVVPQIIENGTNFIQAKINYQDGSNSAFVYRLENKNLMLLKGQEHTFNIVFDLKIGLRLNGSSIKDWVEGDGGGGVISPNDALPAANSFVVGVGDEAVIDCTIAGNDISGVSAYTKALKNPTGGVKSVRLLWQTKSGHTTTGPLVISSVNDTKLTAVRVQTNKAATAGGNAVLAAYDGVNGTGNILWSWHLWITPEKVGLTTYGDKFVAANGAGNAIMDRNLGALSATQAEGNVKTGGMLYQRGRKDPFTGTATGVLNANTALAVYNLAGTAVAATTGAAIAGDGSFKFLASDADNVAASIKNPMTFYNANTSGGWSNPMLDDFWTPFGTLKAVFDPCPNGYRVAKVGSWDDLGTVAGNYGTMMGSDNTKGIILNELGGAPWYPMSGLREWVSGAPVRAANSNNIFGSGGINLFHISITEPVVTPNYDEGRSFGFSVRCVQNNGSEAHLTAVSAGDIPGTGGSAAIKVYTNVGSGWTATISGAGFTLSNSSGSGNGVVTVNASSTTVSRTATVKITSASGAMSRTVTIPQHSQTTIVAGVEWCNFNLDGNAGQSAAVKLVARPQDYGKFFKWGDKWVYDRASSTTDGDWTTNTSGAATVPALGNAGGTGNDYLQGLSGGRASGDPCTLLGADFRTPTHTQFQLLIAAGSSGFKTYNGVNGWFFGAKAAQCNNETLQDGCIFMPAAGLRNYNSGAFDSQGNNGTYWSSSVCDANKGWHLNFFSDGRLYTEANNSRSYGFSVRCVKTPPLPAATVTIAGTEWTTTNITGVVGQATTVVFAPYAEDYGTFFKWGSALHYARASSSTEGAGFANGNYTLGSSIAPTTQSRNYDYVGLNGTTPGDPCRKLSVNYKTPTQTQIAALVASGSSGFRSYNGIAGWFFGPNAATATNTSIPAGCIFLPAAGYRNWQTGSLDVQGSQGNYWSSSVYDANYGWSLIFNSGGIYPEYNNSRSFGLSVRCVKMPVSTPQTVTIAGIKWTTANLTATVAGQSQQITVADNPQDYGLFFKWASIYPYARATNIAEGAGFSNGKSTLGSSTTPIAPTKNYDYVGLNGLWPGDPCQQLGTPYRTPTAAQIKALSDSGKSAGWGATYKGIPGWFFGPNAATATNTSIPAGCIFLPAAGSRHCWTGELTSQDVGGNYWSSSVNDADNGWRLSFGSIGGVNPENFSFRSQGFSVRCIQQ